MDATEDLFTPIHKALRSILYALSSRLQTNDFADVSATSSLLADLESDFAIARSAGCALCILSHHASDEEDAIFPDAAKAGSRLVGTLVAEHHELTRRELAIARAGRALVAHERPEDRIAAGVRLNQEANELFAAYFAHMNREESDLVSWMRERFSDAQMAAMRGTIMGRMPPERIFAILGWMLPSLNATELLEFLRSVRDAMPPPAFRAVTELCRARVDPVRWAAVARDVGL